jgi:uncharacterized protein (TIGR02246 family)
MRYAIRTLAGAALLSLAACTPQPISQADQQAIKDGDAAYVAALNSGNVDALTALYTSDASVLAPGSPLTTGSAAIKAMLTGMMTPMKITIRLTPSKVSGQGDVAYVVGSYHFVATMKDTTQASPPPDDGKYVEVYERQADKTWKISVDIWNSNAMPAMPAPPARPSRRH